MLAELHPEVAYRSCDHCKAWQYDEETGEIQTQLGVPLRRILEDKTPCRTTRGCPKGTPEDSRALNERNVLAYRRYQECKAVGRFPNDPIVRANAATIMRAENQVAEIKRRRELTELIRWMNCKSI